MVVQDRTPAIGLQRTLTSVIRWFHNRQFNPVLFKKINGWLTVFWIVMVPVSIATGWVNSVTYVSALSIYALITGHLATWQAARVEVKQEQTAE